MTTDETHSHSRHWQEFYTQNAPSYDRLVKGPMHYRGHTMVIEKISPHIAAMKESRVRLADLGTGTGLVIAGLRKQFRQAALHGFDFTPEMLVRCQKKHVADSLTLCDLNRSDWPIRRESVDFVTAAGLLEVVQNTGVFFGNMHKILKPDGIAVVTYEATAMPIVRNIREPANENLSPSDMRLLARETGFDVLEQERFMAYRADDAHIFYGIMTMRKGP